jgi:hypothetical protein
LRESGR